MAPRKVSSKGNTSGTSTPTTTTSTTPSSTTSSTTSNSNTIKTNPFLKSTVKKDVSFASTMNSLWSNYLTETDKSLKMIDTLQLFLMLTGISQFLYCTLVTNYPFNAFLGGFSATVGQFVLGASLRAQVNPSNKDTFPNLSPESALGQYIFCSILLHFFVFNYLG